MSLDKYYSTEEGGDKGTLITDKVLSIFDEYEPRHDTVLALPLVSDELLGNILISAEPAKDQPKRAYVIKVGPGGFNKHKTFVEMDLEVGDIIYYMQHNPMQLKVKGELALSLGNDYALVVEKNAC